MPHYFPFSLIFTPHTSYWSKVQLISNQMSHHLIKSLQQEPKYNVLNMNESCPVSLWKHLFCTRAKTNPKFLLPTQPNALQPSWIESTAHQESNEPLFDWIHLVEARIWGFEDDHLGIFLEIFEQKNFFARKHCRCQKR